jgi:hypothetical protein
MSIDNIGMDMVAIVSGKHDKYHHYEPSENDQNFNSKAKKGLEDSDYAKDK